MKTGLISKLQRYSTKDGPGIRSTVFMVGCNLRCLWCANPELMLPDEKYLYYRQHCIHCGACVSLSNGHIRFADEGCSIDRAACLDWAALCEACPRSCYEKIGETVTSSDLAEQLLRDKTFYETSGGGVTFSGGEAALQADFVRETAALLHKKGIHTALDTAGMIPWDKLQILLEEIDLVLYDIKAMDPILHRRCTGADNSLILENAARIAALGKPMWIRLVLVPDCNDVLPDIRARLRFVHSLGSSVRRVDLLKYHSLGADKYTQLGIGYAIPPGTNCSDELVHSVCQIAKEEGIVLHTEN